MMMMMTTTTMMTMTVTRTMTMMVMTMMMAIMMIMDHIYIYILKDHRQRNPSATPGRSNVRVAPNILNNAKTCWNHHVWCWHPRPSLYPASRRPSDAARLRSHRAYLSDVGMEAKRRNKVRKCTMVGQAPWKTIGKWWFNLFMIAKLVNITSITLVYDTYTVTIVFMQWN